MTITIPVEVLLILATLLVINTVLTAASLWLRIRELDELER